MCIRVSVCLLLVGGGCELDRVGKQDRWRYRMDRTKDNNVQLLWHLLVGPLCAHGRPTDDQLRLHQQQQSHISTIISNKLSHKIAYSIHGMSVGSTSNHK